MRRFNEITTTFVLLVALVPLGTYAVLSPEVRDQATKAIEKAVEKVTSGYQNTSNARASKRAHQRAVSQKDQRISELMREKRQVRMQIAAVRRALEGLENDHGLDVSSMDSIDLAFDEQKENLRDFIRYLSAKRTGTLETGPELGGLIVRRLVVASLGDRVEMDLFDRALEQARADFLTLVIDAKDLVAALDTLEQRHTDLLTEYHQTEGDRNFALNSIRLTDEQLKAIKAEVAEVQSQILRMQGELARINAKLQAKAERKLIEKKLLPTQPGERSKGEIVGSGIFSWPVYGRISAAFMDPGYPRVFGVPHYGMDIAVNQGTPVRAAADGIVFLARNGGMGYSYVLVGHRNGYATLYGHLSQIHVTAGQELRRGQQIGLSGGQPGTPGAGLQTTGAHLHFEMIQAGKNINPLAVLP